MNKTIIELREEAIKEDKNPEFYLYQKLEEKDKEIERLNNENKHYKEYIKELKDSLRNCHIKNNKLINENGRLNNIINEIFEWMQNKYDNSDLTGFTVSFQELQDLKELKEGNDNER